MFFFLLKPILLSGRKSYFYFLICFAGYEKGL